MKTDNPIQQKSYAFAVRVVKMCRHLAKVKKERVLEARPESLRIAGLRNYEHWY